MKSYKYALTALVLIFAAIINKADAQSASDSDSNKPNIIWLVLEDISLDLSVYGTPEVKTPNLDRLANEGIRYNHAYATAAVCSTARSAFFTGMHATSIGAQNHRSHLDDGYYLPKNIKMTSQFMREAGYVNLLMGPKQKTDFNFSTTINAFDAQDGEVKYSGGAYTHAPTDLKLLERPAWQTYIKKYSGQPFFAQINYSETHRTFIADKKNPIDPSKVKIPSYYPDHDITRRDWALYLETIQTVDQKVGNLFSELEKAGVLENTIVFIFGDHGRAMLRDKQWLYDGGLRVPLIVWGKGIESNQVNNELVSLIDVMPTTLDLVGLKVPDYVEGHIFLGKNKQKRDYIYAHKDRTDETDDRVRAVRNLRFKYIKNFYPEKPYNDFNAYKHLQYPVLALMESMHAKKLLTHEQALFFAPNRPQEELYDTFNDPDEVNNLALNKNYEEQLLTMRKELQRWQKATNDQGMIDETPEVKEYWDDFFKKHYLTQMRLRGLSPKITPDDYLIFWDKFLTEQGK
ncbi:sulfatase family protein [Pseudoalteromonas distincta]|uniref:sulfatase family protein n=1 Tax=Pseudoalteromonas distincta TaxID=77608 RepID=UPI0011F28290|nr:sulfatase [Pseudoalteromonas distincta]KAA1160881.1 sulfatase [Pseudoalteromonas distincta]